MAAEDLNGRDPNIDDETASLPDGQGASPDAPQPRRASEEHAHREVTFTRRALIQASWTVPVVMAIGIPKTAFAQVGSPVGHVDIPNPHIDTGHGDTGHGDVAHNDSPHSDTRHNDAPHSDSGRGPTHSDAPHDDTGHIDAPHGDSGHADAGHGDASHGDA